MTWTDWELRAMNQPVEYSDPRHPDMSPEAIASRLAMVDNLRRLALSLREAGRYPARPVVPARPSETTVHRPHNETTL